MEKSKHIGITNQPINNVLWIHRSKLRPNHYNPNSVAPPEMELLKVSIIEDGWTQPVVVLPEDKDGIHDIVDGFHRYTDSGDPDIAIMTDEMVPCVIIDADKTHRMMSTIRHNRARGTHAVIRMAEIIATMINDGVSMPEMMRRLGMEDEEVLRLANRAGLPENIINKGTEFGRAFVPDIPDGQ
jgi:ParB-like chromosome segregation protein Spo0J